MKQIGLAWVALCALVLSTAGCATITKGTNQAIAIGSQPPGADCALTRAGQPLGTVTTPGSITVKRDAKPLSVLCTKVGYEEARAVMNAQTESATYGNIILGGAIGSMVDASSGANNRYEASLMVELTPLSAADQAAAAVSAKEPPAPAVLAVPAPTVAAVSPGPFDGDYTGGMEFRKRGSYSIKESFREIDIHIVGGIGIGTARAALCPDPGKVSLSIDPSGAITGDFNLLNAGCYPMKSSVTGGVDGDRLKLEVHLANQQSIEFSLLRSAKVN